MLAELRPDELAVPTISGSESLLWTEARRPLCPGGLVATVSGRGRLASGPLLASARNRVASMPPVRLLRRAVGPKSGREKGSSMSEDTLERPFAGAPAIDAALGRRDDVPVRLAADGGLGLRGVAALVSTRACNALKCMQNRAVVTDRLLPRPGLGQPHLALHKQVVRGADAVAAAVTMSARGVRNTAANALCVTASTMLDSLSKPVRFMCSTTSFCHI